VTEYRDAAIASPVFQKEHGNAFMEIQKNRALAEKKYQQTPRTPVED
jgi:hypothetical protein